MRQSSETDGLSCYLSQLEKCPVLNREDEYRLAVRYRDFQDVEAAWILVTANLRFVIKVSFGYRTYGVRMQDVIQEGNIGLMMAVEGFDPEKGYRLVSYAVWWIRAYIQNYLIRSRSLVKIGTTQAQRKLFYRIADLPEASDYDDHMINVAKLAKRVGVKATEVIEMAGRMKAHDLSLDRQVRETSQDSFADTMSYDGPNQEQSLIELEELKNLQAWTRQALATLSRREKYIIKKRVLAEDVMTLNQLGKHLGITRSLSLNALQSH